jgi:hypothetical protein
MNIALARLIEGMIATLRADVIPHVADPYARGQAVGVIDLLNAVAPRIEWARAPLRERLMAKRLVIDELSRIMAVDALPELDADRAGTDELIDALARCDAVLSGAFAAAIKGGATPPAPAPHHTALALLKAHVQQDMTAEMKLTRKPLFAEIAAGAAGPRAGKGEEDR